MRHCRVQRSNSLIYHLHYNTFTIIFLLFVADCTAIGSGTSFLFKFIGDLGHILRMEEHRVTRHSVLQSVKPALETLFGDVPDFDVYTAINCAMKKVEWKAHRPSRRC